MIERYSLPGMKSIWNEETKYKKWVQVEVEVISALMKNNIIPQFNIEMSVDWDKFVDECKEEEKTTKHDVVAFLNVLEKRLSEHSGVNSRFVHYGMTSSDLVDTALALQIKLSLEEIGESLHNLLTHMTIFRTHHSKSVMIGRTHGMHAEPTTLGHVMNVYVQEFLRHQDRFGDMIHRVTAGKLSGAVGTYAHIPPEIERDVISKLGLEIEAGPNQIVQRDRHAELLNWMALVGCSLEKLATQIRHLSRSEICEVSEGHGKGYKGSSSMPHKRNPINSENICGLSRLLRGYALAGMEDVALWHERDISHSSVERIAIPDAFCVLHFMLERMATVISNLEVHTDLMRERVTRSTEWQSQAIMLRLIEEGMPRKDAHNLVQKDITNAISSMKNPDNTGLERHLQYITQQDADISTVDDT